jgi:hypothetical protein
MSRHLSKTWAVLLIVASLLMLAPAIESVGSTQVFQSVAHADGGAS